MGDEVGRLLAGLEQGLAFVTALASPDMTIEWISPSVADLTGWTAADLIGRNAVELVHPDDLDGVIRILDAERHVPRPYGDDPARASVNRVRFLTADGSWRALDVGANNRCHDPRVNGFVFVLADRHAQGLTDAVYDALASGDPIVTIVTRIGELISWQVGRSRVRVEVDGLADVMVGEVHGDTRIERLEIPGIGAISVDHPVDTEASEWFRVLLERGAGLLRIAVNRHHGEQLLRRRLDEKTAIISAVSHDLRSPLAAIQLMSTLLDGNGESLSPDQRRHLAARINADAQRTSRLLADLTSVDRLLHGRNDTVVRRVVLADVARLVIDGVEADGRRVQFVEEVADVVVAADPVLTERVLDNLVANACKHTPVTSHIRLTVTAVDGTGVVHVDDDGPGVPPGARQRIFDAYVRGEDDHDRPGSGVGLFLARTFADVQNGSVSCTGSPLGGARFSVYLPIWRA